MIKPDWSILKETRCPKCGHTLIPNNEESIFQCKHEFCRFQIKFSRYIELVKEIKQSGSPNSLKKLSPILLKGKNKKRISLFTRKTVMIYFTYYQWFGSVVP